jgi:CubicO group peptidase (beta-lactamase class C family)
MLLRRTTLVLCLALCAGLAGASPVFPDTAEGKRLAAFFAAADAGTEAAVRSFIEGNFPTEALNELPLEQRLKNIYGFISRRGPFEVLRILPPRPNSVGAVVRSKPTGELLQVSLETEEGPRRGVLGLRVEDAGPQQPDEPAAVRKPAASDAELAAAAEAAATELAARDAFSGVVLLARNGKPFFQKAWGLADRGLSVPNRVDTRFNIGSIGKAFTRVAVMDLVKAGRISLTDTVAKHLPGIRIPAADRITIDQLLEMTSGLGDIFGGRYEETPKDKLRELSDYLRLFEGQPLRFQPGQGREYSNAGYVVLGLIIEKVSGKPYWDFVRESVLAPAGMQSTGAWGPDEVVPNRAVGYTREQGGWRSNVYGLPGRASSAGGVDSTAGDLLAFAAARGPRGIAGGTPGANAVLEGPDKSGLTIIILANMDPPVAEKLARQIRSLAPSPDKR